MVTGPKSTLLFRLQQTTETERSNIKEEHHAFSCCKATRTLGSTSTIRHCIIKDKNVQFKSEW